MEPVNFHALKAYAEHMTLLYVEDNAGLRKKVVELLEKVFQNVAVAYDAKEGMALYRQLRPKIVLSGRKMPGMSGLELARRIRRIDADVKIIITSTSDDKAYLLEAIKSGVFRYLKKPFGVDALLEALFEAAESLESTEHRDILTVYMHDILNYQSNLLLLMREASLLYANRAFLDFFEIETLEEFQERYGELGRLMETHKGFLYDQEGVSWFEQVRLNPDKLFHVKIGDRRREPHHFVLKFHPIPEKAGYFILSLNDITELNLMALFDERATQHDRDMKDQVKLFKLFDVMRQNSAKVKVLNFYKGLTIANDALIANVDEEGITIKTNFIQLKAIQYQSSLTISSSSFPMDVMCSEIRSVDFEEQTIRFSGAKFSERSPSARKNVRVVPEEDHMVTLFYMERKYFGESRILDLSISSVKIELDALPAGLKRDEEVVVDMVLPQSKAPLIINAKGRVFRIDQNRYHYQIVILLELHGDSIKELSGYIAKRQIDLIREFKGMQIGK